MNIEKLYCRADTSPRQDESIKSIALALSAGHDEIEIYHLSRLVEGGSNAHLLARHQGGATFSIEVGNGGGIHPTMDQIEAWVDLVVGRVSAPANSTILPWRLTSEGSTLAAFEGYPSEDLVTALVDDLSDEWTVTWKGEAI